MSSFAADNSWLTCSLLQNLHICLSLQVVNFTLRTLRYAQYGQHFRNWRSQHYADCFYFQEKSNLFSWWPRNPGQWFKKYPPASKGHSKAWQPVRQASMLATADISQDIEHWRHRREGLGWRQRCDGPRHTYRRFYVSCISHSARSSQPQLALAVRGIFGKLIRSVGCRYFPNRSTIPCRHKDPEKAISFSNTPTRGLNLLPPRARVYEAKMTSPLSHAHLRWTFN